MKSVTIVPEFSADPELNRLIGIANAILDRELGPSAGEVEAIWYHAGDNEDPLVGPSIGLMLKDGLGAATRIFPRSELLDTRRVAANAIRFWGELLKDRSHKQLAKMLESSAEAGTH